MLITVLVIYFPRYEFDSLPDVFDFPSQHSLLSTTPHLQLQSASVVHDFYQNEIIGGCPLNLSQ